MHASYFVGPEIWSHMSEPDRTRLTHDRAQYKRQSAEKTIASMNAQQQVNQSYLNNNYSWQPQHQIQAAAPYTNTNASIQQSYATPQLPSQVLLPPPPPPAFNDQLNSSQVSEMSRGSGTFMGGRNERALQGNRHNQGGQNPS